MEYIISLKNENSVYGWNDWKEDTYKEAKERKEWLEDRGYSDLVIRKSTTQ